MILPSEIRVWSLIWPRRARRGNVRTVSTASARADLLAATSASAADRARLNVISVAAAAPCATREASGTPLSLCSAGCSAIGTTSSGISPSPASHFTQAATVGQVWLAALEPTTRPKCPVRMRYS